MLRWVVTAFRRTWGRDRPQARGRYAPGEGPTPADLPHLRCCWTFRYEQPTFNRRRPGDPSWQGHGAPTNHHQ